MQGDFLLPFGSGVAFQLRGMFQGGSNVGKRAREALRAECFDARLRQCCISLGCFFTLRLKGAMQRDIVVAKQKGGFVCHTTQGRQILRRFPLCEARKVDHRSLHRRFPGAVSNLDVAAPCENAQGGADAAPRKLQRAAENLALPAP